MKTLIKASATHGLFQDGARWELHRTGPGASLHLVQASDDEAEIRTAYDRAILIAERPTSALAEACADLIAAGETVLRLDFDTHGMHTLNRALQVARHALADWQAADKEDR